VKLTKANYTIVIQRAEGGPPEEALVDNVDYPIHDVKIAEGAAQRFIKANEVSDIYILETRTVRHYKGAGAPKETGRKL
jgi:hypothetical protein